MTEKSKIRPNEELYHCYDLECDVRKQLKRKEQECERLKNKHHKSIAKMTVKEIDQSTYIKQLEKVINRIRTEQNQYKEENEELNKYKPIVDRLLTEFETYDRIKSLDIVTFAKQTFKQLDQLKAELQAEKEKVNELRTQNEKLKEDIKTKTGKDFINEIQDITMKYECHQKSMGVCWWGKYGKETECIGIRECHRRELEVIQKLETDLKTETRKIKEIEETNDRNFVEAVSQRQRADKYERALEEIKEIANKYINTGQTASTYYDILNYFKKQILQKISEVEVEK